MITKQQIKQFQQTIWNFYINNRRDFPWRNTTNPYHILVSEVMLQQTQTYRVLPKYEQFLHELPTFDHLANASLSDVLALWSGLGYNRRALFLQESAQIIINNDQGIISRNPSDLEKLPGIGKSTARSIIVFTYNIPIAFIETNIRRVFIHFFFQDQESISDREILPLVEQTMNKKSPREWFYALMDYGVMLAQTQGNANKKSAHYTKQSTFTGSIRKVRGEILRQLIEYKNVNTQDLFVLKDNPIDKVQQALDGLEKDNMIRILDDKIVIR